MDYFHGDKHTTSILDKMVVVGTSFGKDKTLIKQKFEMLCIPFCNLKHACEVFCP